MKIVLLNGPPRSGKDTIARGLALLADRDVKIERFAAPLEGAARAFGFDMCDSRKEELHPCLLATRRAFQIALSEEFIKPRFGAAAFGALLVQRLRMLSRLPDLLAVPDSGFRPEAQILADAFGAKNILLMRVHREGCSFAGDSRSYWPRLVGIAVETIDNDGSIPLLEERAWRIVKEWAGF